MEGRGVPATTPDEVRECAGSFYNQTLALAHVDFKGYVAAQPPPGRRDAV